MKILINTLFVWLLSFNLSSLFVTLFPPVNATRCLQPETTNELDRWLYRTTLINLIVTLCLGILFNLIYWLMESSEEPDQEEGALEKCYRWLTTYFPLILLTFLYAIVSIIIVVQSIGILAECQYNSLSSLFASIHCLNVFLFLTVLLVVLMKPVFEVCRARLY